MREKTAERIQRDLERRGVAPELSESISSHLERFTEDLTPDTYEAVLSGVVMAAGIQRRGAGTEAVRSDLEEIHRLMNDFASELHKLDEALETLAAYLVRMRTRTREPARVLH